MAKVTVIMLLFWLAGPSPIALGGYHTCALLAGGGVKALALGDQLAGAKDQLVTVHERRIPPGTLRAVTRVALFSFSAGAGHIRAAAAIEAASRIWFDDVQATHIDMATVVDPVTRTIYVDGYIRVVKQAPWLWGRMYKATDAPPSRNLLNRGRLAIEKVSARNFKNVLRELNPDHVISTHFMAPQLMAQLLDQGRIQIPSWVTITDIACHAAWMAPRATGYLVADDGIADLVAARGVPRETAHATGIPIDPVFARRWSRETCAEVFGLDPSKPTVAVIAGNAGVTPVDRLVGPILALRPDLQVITVAGRNAALKARIDALAAQPEHRGRLHSIGHTTQIELVMAAADLAVTKPGPQTMSECMALGLPMVLVSPIPGQEEYAAHHVAARGAALEVADGTELIAAVRRLVLDDRSALDRMREAALAMGRPFAARSALEVVLGRPADRPDALEAPER